MHTNFNGLKRHVTFGPEKSIKLLIKTAVTLLPSNPNHHERYLPNKIYRFCHLYEIIHSEIEALSFSKLSIKIGYILLRHPAEVWKKFQLVS